MPRVARRKPTYPFVPIDLLQATGPEDLEKVPALQDTPGQRYGIRHPRQRAFLAAYSQLPNVSKCAEISGISRAQVYVWRERDPTFQAAMEHALSAAIEKLETSAYMDAMGGEVATRIFLLKSHKPELYDREKHLRVSATLEGEITGGSRDEADPSRLTTAELIVYRALRRKALERDLDELDEQALEMIERATDGGDDGERKALSRGAYNEQRAAG